MKRMKYGMAGLMLAAMLVQVGCAQSPPTATGNTPTDATDVTTAAQPGPKTVPLGVMGKPVPGLTQQQLAVFAQGQHVFERVVQRDSHEVANDVSCIACHGGGGAGGASEKFAQNYVEVGPGDFPVPNTQAPFTEAWLQQGGSLGNVGFMGHVLNTPEGEEQLLPTPQFGGAIVLSKRLSTMTAGTGYLAAIPAHQIKARALAQNTGLGISGRVGVTAALGPPPANPDELIGRFGWKLRTNTVAAFNAGALFNELGQSSNSFAPLVQRFDMPFASPFIFQPFAPPPAPSLPANMLDATLDVTDSDKAALDVFTSLANAPAPRAFNQLGYNAFKKAGCIECHWDGYTTTNNPLDLPVELRDYIGALGGGKRVPAYTDLLAHNMGVGKLEDVKDLRGHAAKASFDGKGLADGVAETVASDEYRTAPLWGLRFKTKFLHNGSASTIDEAVRNHYYVSPSGNSAYNSEANEVIKNYLGTNRGKKGNLSSLERAWMMHFLRQL